MNGLIELPLDKKNTKRYVVHGGAYRKKPTDMVGVKMAAEIHMACTVDIPTQDFSTPSKKLMDKGLYQTIRQLVAGRPVYVGCMGGIGRTGLLLAVLLKAFGVKNPVGEVRRQYLPHAVETRQQMDYVNTYKIPAKVKLLILWAKLSNLKSTGELNPS